jgi:predicted small lipoprotein YifL
LEEGKVKIIVAVTALVMLSACGGKQNIKLPPPPKTTEVVVQNIPVPVLCTVEIKRAKVKLDSLQDADKLELQTAALRETIAEQKSYIVALEAGIIGCGGKIN